MENKALWKQPNRIEHKIQQFSKCIILFKFMISGACNNNTNRIIVPVYVAKNFVRNWPYRWFSNRNTMETYYRKILIRFPLCVFVVAFVPFREYDLFNRLWKFIINSGSHYSIQIYCFHNIVSSFRRLERAFSSIIFINSFINENCLSTK